MQNQKVSAVVNYEVLKHYKSSITKGTR